MNATLSNHNNTSGGVFPYSASRMRSLVVDDDPFTSPAFHRFLVQGLRSYLSSGMAFNWLSKEEIIANEDMDDDDDGEQGISCDKVHFQAGVDLIQLLAMAICPNPPSEKNDAVMTASEPTATVPSDAKKGGERELEGAAIKSVSWLANSTVPFSFQLSYSDRLQLVRLCADLVIPESEDDTGYAVEGRYVGSGGNDARSESEVMFSAALYQLRSSLFGFASYNAHSDTDAEIGFNALANVVIREAETSSIQFELQRLVQVTMNSRSECLAIALGDGLADLITRYNGSRYYADGAFIRFALDLLSKCVTERMQMCMAGNANTSGEESTNQTDKSLEGTAVKRQKTEETPSAAPNTCKSYHLIALLKATRPLFYFLLGEKAASKVSEEDALGRKEEAKSKTAENITKSQLIRGVTLLLCYPSGLSVVQSASQLLALALAYDEKYITEKSNVKYLFRYTRQALDNGSVSIDAVQALRPLLITASRQSRTFASSLFSFAVKTCSENKRVSWKLANVISSACPSVVADRLAELGESSKDNDKCCGEVIQDEIMTRLNCTMSSFTIASSETIEHCSLLAEGITNHWTLFKLVRYAFITSNFGFARHIIEQRQLPLQCSQQNTFLWLTIISKLAHGEEILGVNGAVGISDSLEELSSCHSALLSLAAIEQNTNPTSSLELGNFGFQLEFLRVRIDFLNLIMTTRSLCSEMILTGGNISARSNLVRKNIPKCFSMLKSRYINIYRLHGLHYCQQTRSVLRTVIAMCQFMSDLVDAILPSKSTTTANNKNCESSIDEQGVTKDCHPKGDERYPMGCLISRLRVGVLQKIQQSKDNRDISHTSELLELLDLVTRCPSPFPPGFFRVKSIPCSSVNISASTEFLPTKPRDYDIASDMSGAELIDVTLGVPFKLVLSGIIPDEFTRSVGFSQIIAWKRIHYERQLYEDDDAEDTPEASIAKETQLDLSNGDSTTLQPCGQFILPLYFDPVVRDGFYRVEVKLGNRDIRCGEWMVPTKKNLQVFLRVE